MCKFPGCGKTFSESSNFAKHRKTHGEEGQHACKVPGCRKTFHRSDQLKKHMKKHTQEQGEYWANSVDGNGELEVNHEEKDDESED